MKKRLLVETWGDFRKIPNLSELMPVEMSVASKLRDQGLIESLLIKDGLKGAYIVYTETDKEKVAEILKTLPLYPYFEKIEYTLVDKTY